MELTPELKVWAVLQLKPDAPAQPVAKAVIEPGAVCDLRCPFCPTGNGDLALGRGLMDLGRFRAVLDALGPSVRELSLFNWGEPLLNPEIYAMLELAAERGIETLVSTNLASPAFDAAKAERLVRSGLARLAVSCDGAGQETYERYRVGGDFSRVMENLRLILDAKRRLGAARPEVSWHFLVHRGNAHELEAAAARAAELGVTIKFRELHVPQAQRAGWSAGPAELARADALAGAAPAGSGPSQAPELSQACLQLWDTAVVHADGAALPCCVVNSAEWSLGSVLEEPLEALRNKPLAVAMRRYLKSGRREAERLPCYGCPHDPHRRGCTGA